MSIWTDKKGRRHVGIMVDGRRVHRILPQDATAGAAKQLEADLRAALAVAKTPRIPSDPRLTEVISLYVAHAETLRSTKTALDHARRIALWLEKYRASQARQAAAHIVKDMAGHYAAGTINRSLGTLKKALRLAWERGLIPVDYSAHVKRLPENNARSTYLSLDQVQSIASHCSTPVQAAIWTALLTGARRGEIVKLRREDIGRDSLIIHAGNTKTLRTRTVPIVPALRPWLKHFPLEVGIEGIKSAWRRAREDAGMPDVNFHDLRHSCASILIATGADLFTVSKILGHSSVKTTERYAHMQIEQQRDAMLRAFKAK
ncbi:site-specific integrase [Thiobacillus sp. 65-1402]|uniref:tyrosine-type recombinase/integrase n=1 Tax=Thiobacillus sp. 65-1402 TaxID=1895861 RepID=UPI000963B3C8|nr:site-specific integrase [Thiobacillus sp. 65-1402]OJW78013.1 MAG: integrase [Thiobacillus sp. 65-1402]